MFLKKREKTARYHDGLVVGAAVDVFTSANLDVDIRKNNLIAPHCSPSAVTKSSNAHAYMNDLKLSNWVISDGGVDGVGNTYAKFVDPPVSSAALQITKGKSVR